MTKKIVLTRIVTCYKQWDRIAMWISDDGIYGLGIEWIILNDCPEDPCPKGIKELAEDKGVRIIDAPTNVGRSNLRNFGIEEAKGEWVDNIDGDDIPLPIDLEKIILKDSDIYYYKFSPHRLNKEQVVSVSIPESMISDYQKIIFPQYGINYPMPANLLYRRNVILALKGYDARFEANEDNHLLWKAYVAGFQVQLVEEPKQSYCIHDENAKAESYYSTVGRIKFCELLLNRHPEHENTIRIAMEQYLLKHLVTTAMLAKEILKQNEELGIKSSRKILRVFGPVSRDICLLSKVLSFGTRVKLSVSYLLGLR